MIHVKVSFIEFRKLKCFCGHEEISYFPSVINKLSLNFFIMRVFYGKLVATRSDFFQDISRSPYVKFTHKVLLLLVIVYVTENISKVLGHPKYE